jgi:hypothetical protein
MKKTFDCADWDRIGNEVGLMLINEVITRFAVDNFNLKGHGCDSVGRHPMDTPDLRPTPTRHPSLEVELVLYIVRK